MSTPESFWKKVAIVEEEKCWLWQGYTDPKGYGQLRYQKHNYPAHRLAYILTYGELDKQEVIGHHCLNNTCCNPSHLYTFSQHNSVDTFWDKIKKAGPNDCWLWTKSTNEAGYGIVRYQGKRWTASRLAYILSNDPFDLSLFVCHRCDNPPCCNPAHLFLGTSADNIHDMISKGRSVYGTAILSKEKALAIRAECNLLQIAERYGVKPRTIFECVTDQTWKD